MKPKIIAFVNQKGGVAKTTTTAHFAWGLAKKYNYKVLAIDFDPQGNLTSYLGGTRAGRPTVMEWLGAEPRHKPTAFEDVVIKVNDNLDYLPADITLSPAEVYLSQALARERYLKNRIEQISKYYDYILIDSSPSLGVLTVNALTACDSVVIPLKPEKLCLDGTTTLISTIDSIRENCNAKIKINGFVLTMCDNRWNVEEVTDNLADIAEEAKTKVYNARIRTNADIGKAPMSSLSVWELAPQSIGANDYTELLKEFIDGE